MVRDGAPGASVERDDDLLIPAAGETVAATRFGPEDRSTELPAVLMYVPYRKDDYITFGAHLDVLQYVAARGYEVVVADLVGTGASSGTLAEPYEPGHADEVGAVVEWLADRDWCDGSVGMYGHSWGGQTQLVAAAQDPDPLGAIVPVQPAVDRYEDLYYRGGARTLNTFPLWFQTLQALPPGRRDDAGRWAEVWHDRLDTIRSTEPHLFESLAHERKDDYWQRRVLPTDVDVPMLMVASYRDLHPQCDVDCFSVASGPKRLVVGPWHHGLPHKAPRSPIDFRAQVVEWYDRFLKGDDGDRDHPPVEYWTELDAAAEDDPGVWRAAEGWPPDGDGGVEFALTPDGLAELDAFETGSLAAPYRYDVSVGAYSSEFPTPSPLDTTPDDVRSLRFESAPLEAALELTGTPTATVRLEATTPDPLVAVRLVDVAPDGTGRLVSFGYLRASHRDGHEHPAELVPGEQYTVTVPLRPRSHVFAPDHRVRACIAAAQFPTAVPSGSMGSFTVRSSPGAPSSITLPGRRHGDGVSFDDAVAVSPPAERPVPVHSRWVERSDEEWSHGRTYPANEKAFRERTAKTVDVPWGVRLDFSKRLECTVRQAAPDSYAFEAEVVGRLEFPEETVEATTTGRVSDDDAHLHTVVTVDGAATFDESWRRAHSPGGPAP